MSLGKNADVYGKFLDDLDSFASSRMPENLRTHTDRVWNVLTSESGLSADDKNLLSGHSDYTRRIAILFYIIAEHRKSHKILEIGGAHREMATERRAYDALVKTVDLLHDFFIPAKIANTNSVNALVKDVNHLSLAYVQTVVNMAVDEYLAASETFDAKTKATLLARRAFETNSSYDFTPESLEGIVNVNLSLVKRSLDEIGSASKLRDFELVQVKPKELAHKKRATKNLIASLPSDYAPDFIVPIAQGGIELGVQLDSHYHSLGYRPTCYPVMFSVKTRKQSRPRTFPDGYFLDMAQDKAHLITEDWITTGRTVVGVLGDLTSRQPRDIRVATIKQDPRSFDNALLKSCKIYTGEVSVYPGKITDSRRDS